MATGIGTMLKLGVSVGGLSPLTMDDVELTADFFVYNNRSVRLEKRDMLRENENLFIAIVDTSLLGNGEVRFRITVDIPDTDMESGTRREVIVGSTGEKIVG